MGSELHAEHIVTQRYVFGSKYADVVPFTQDDAALLPLCEHMLHPYRWRLSGLLTNVCVCN